MLVTGRSCQFSDLEPVPRLKIAFAPKPVVHRGVQASERYAMARLEHTVGHRQGVIEHGIIGEITHGEVIDPANGTEVAGALGLDALDGKLASEHVFTVRHYRGPDRLRYEP